MTCVLVKLILLGFIYSLSLTTEASRPQSAPIIAGSRATVGQFPWHAILSNERANEICGGSIISNIWILTVAHCIHNVTEIDVIFGTIDITNPIVKMTSSIFFIHPGFIYETLIHDIGLIKLSKAVLFNHNIERIELVSSNESGNNFIGTQAIITGFGRIRDAKTLTSRWLLYATVEIVSNAECDMAYGEKTPDTVLCVVGANRSKKSACEGDSGGPLVWMNQANKFVQIGMFSYFAEDKCSKFPTGYTKITPYLDYIHRITGLKF